MSLGPEDYSLLFRGLLTPHRFSLRLRRLKAEKEFFEGQISEAKAVVYDDGQMVRNRIQSIRNCALSYQAVVMNTARQLRDESRQSEEFDVAMEDMEEHLRVTLPETIRYLNNLLLDLEFPIHPSLIYQTPAEHQNHTFSLKDTPSVSSTEGVFNISAVNSVSQRGSVVECRPVQNDTNISVIGRGSISSPISVSAISDYILDADVIKKGHERG